jgi:hypothetical protein
VTPRCVYPTPCEPQSDGLLILLKPERANLKWRSTVGLGPSSIDDYLEALIKATGHDRSRYRGISRYPVGRGSANPKLIPPDSPQASQLLFESYGEEPALFWQQPPWLDGDAVPSLLVARKVRAATSVPEAFEIVRVELDKDQLSPGGLGFDIGRWGDDHFSILADALIWPTWHPCPREELRTLIPWAGTLNEHGLFASAEAARRYREWYIAQQWTETESEAFEFQPIRVSAVGRIDVHLYSGGRD